MRLALSIDATDRDTWHMGSREVEGPDRKASSYLWMTSLRAGIASSLEAEIALPVAWMDARDGDERVQTSSIGDVPTLLTWTRQHPSWSWSLTGGVYWPTGEIGADSLPATANFSTGTIDPTFAVQLLGPAWRGWNWQLATVTRQVIQEKEDGSRLGSSITTTFGVSRAIGRRLVGQVLAMHFHREEDQHAPMGTGMMDMAEDSGGDWLYLQPQLVGSVLTRPDHALQVMLGARLPLVQNVVGMQLVDSPTVTLGVAYTRNR